MTKSKNRQRSLLADAPASRGHDHIGMVRYVTDVRPDQLKFPRLGDHCCWSTTASADDPIGAVLERVINGTAPFPDCPNHGSITLGAPASHAAKLVDECGPCLELVSATTRDRNHPVETEFGKGLMILASIGAVEFRPDIAFETVGITAEINPLEGCGLGMTAEDRRTASVVRSLLIHGGG